MYSSFLYKIAKNKVVYTFLVSLTGISCGFLTLLFFFNLPSTFATFAAVAMISPLVLIVSGDSKRLLWFGLVICLPITVDFTINHTGHKGGAGGYVISVFDIILALLYLLWFTELISKKQKNIKFFPEISIPAVFLIGLACLSIIPAQNPHILR